MNVLIDVEWLAQGPDTKYITQIAASRVTEAFESMAHFSCLVRPPDAENCDWEHMAYRGHSPDEFLNGDDEAGCLVRFAGFLREDDVLCVWSRDAEKVIREKYELHTGNTIANSIVCVNDQVDGIARKRERNALILERERYNFVFTPASHVFHRRSCKLIFGANEINGCVCYETAAQNRRPCKICRPEPEGEDKGLGGKGEAFPEAGAGETSSGAAGETSTEAGAGETSPEAGAGEISPEADAGEIFPGAAAGETSLEGAAGETSPSAMVYETASNTVVSAKLLGDQRIQIKKGKLVGCCHNAIHPGKLTAKIMGNHDCVGKQCRYFEKYEDASYWIDKEKKRKKKEERREEKRRKKMEAQRIEDELGEMREMFQSYVDAFGYAMLIVRIQKEKNDHYKVFYVSENRFVDGNRFPSFLETVRYYFPKCRIELRHIRDVDGHFVTIDEYVARKGISKRQGKK